MIPQINLRSTFSKELLSSLLLLLIAIFWPYQGAYNILYILLFVLFLQTSGYIGTKVAWWQLIVMLVIIAALVHNRYESLIQYPLILFWASILFPRINGKIYRLLAVLLPLILLGHQHLSFLPLQPSNLGTLININILVFLLALTETRNHKDDNKKQLEYLCYANIILAIYLQSRLAFVAFAAIGLLYLFERLKNKKSQTVLALLICLTFIYLLFAKTSSLSGRMTLNLFVLHNYFSWDWGTFFHYVPFSHWYTTKVISLEASATTQIIGEVYQSAFNDYLQILVEFGVLPFLIFLGFNAYLLVLALRSRQFLDLIALVIVQLMLATSFAFSSANSLFILILVYLGLLRKYHSSFPIVDLDKSFAISRPLIVGALAGLLAIYYLPRLQLMQELESPEEISTTSLIHRYTLRNHDAKVLLAYHLAPSQILLQERVYQYLARRHSSYGLLLHLAEVKEKLGKYEEARQYYLQAKQLRPFALFPLYKLVLISKQQREVDKLEEFIRAAEQISLRVENSLTIEMQEAIQSIKQEFNL